MQETKVDGDSRSRKAECVVDLRRRVLTQELEPGAYLDEVELSERYGISRPPLREVLRQLVGRVSSSA
ncbi:GntR family transcriptional regulator [Gemmobacter lanyuensis]